MICSRHWMAWYWSERRKVRSAYMYCSGGSRLDARSISNSNVLSPTPNNPSFSMSNDYPKHTQEYKKSSMTVLYLNSLLSAIGVSIVIMLVPGETSRVSNFTLWYDFSFLTYLVFASLMGSVLNLAIFLCTSTNSALTTTVVGCLKNVLTSYLGMFVGGDYIFSWLNFLGINISIAGSLIYARATFRG